MDGQTNGQMMNGWTDGSCNINSLIDVIMFLKRLPTILEHQLMFMVSDLCVRYLIMLLLFTVDFESKYSDDDVDSVDMIDLWKHVSNSSRSIEINYETKDNKEILTRVYFPFDPSVSTCMDRQINGWMDGQMDG